MTASPAMAASRTTGPPIAIADMASTGVAVALGPGLTARATLIGLAESVGDGRGVGVGSAVTLGAGVGAAVGVGARGDGVAAAAGAAFGGIGWIET